MQCEFGDNLMKLEIEEQMDLAARLKVKVDQLEEIRSPRLQVEDKDGNRPLGGLDFRRQIREKFKLPGSEWLGKELWEKQILTFGQAVWIDSHHAQQIAVRELQVAKSAAEKILLDLAPNLEPASLVFEKIERLTPETASSADYPFPIRSPGWEIALSYREEYKEAKGEVAVLAFSRQLSSALGGGPRNRVTLSIDQYGNMNTYRRG
jgi:hypothetical protein